MKKADLKSISSIKGFKFELKLSMDSFENDSTKRSRDGEELNSKSVKDFEFNISMEAEEASIDFDMFAKEIDEHIKDAIAEANNK